MKSYFHIAWSESYNIVVLQKDFHILLNVSSGRIFLCQDCPLLGISSLINGIFYFHLTGYYSLSGSPLLGISSLINGIFHFHLTGYYSLSGS
ncbi:hypothetical protein Ahia01_000548900 [Argonauta hians]